MKIYRCLFILLICLMKLDGALDDEAKGVVQNGNFTLSRFHGEQKNNIYSIGHEDKHHIIGYPRSVYAKSVAVSNDGEAVLLNLYEIETESVGASNFFGLILIERVNGVFYTRELLTIGDSKPRVPKLAVLALKQNFALVRGNLPIKVAVRKTTAEGGYRYDHQWVIFDLKTGGIQPLNQQNKKINP